MTRTNRPPSTLTIAAFAAAICHAPAAVRAEDCGEAILSAPRLIDLLVEPFDGDTDQAFIEFEVTPAEQAPCASHIEVGPAEGFGWELIGPSGIAAPTFRLDDRELSAAANLSAPTPEDGRVRLVMSLPDASFLSAGRYQTTLQAELFDDNGEILGPTRFIDAIVTAPSRAQINVAGGASAFGTLPALDRIVLRPNGRGGAFGRAFLQVRANTDVNISLSSANAGRLMHMTNPSLTIPYTLTVGGQSIPLADRAVIQHRPTPSIAGSNLAMDVQLTNNRGPRFAGRYRDVISITVEPQ